MTKNGSIIMGILIALLLLFTTGCNLSDGDSPPTKYAIGDTGPSGVGIVFYVTDGGLHGLEVSTVDQSTFSEWSNITDEEIGTTGEAIGTGFLNTDAIIGQAGHTDSVAQICRNYRAVEEGDWFLPSKDELNAIWENLVDDGSGGNSGVGGFAERIYWSSSEYNGTIVCCQWFDDGYKDHTN